MSSFLLVDFIPLHPSPVLTGSRRRNAFCAAEGAEVSKPVVQQTSDLLFEVVYFNLRVS